MEVRTIKEASGELEAHVRELIERSCLRARIPPDYQPEVSLENKKGRKKRSNASVDNWSPQSGDEIRIRFTPSSGWPATPAEPTETRVAVPVTAGSPPTANAARFGAPPSGTSASVADLVRALDRAESSPGFQFVALKWFRDVFLPAQGLEWTRSGSGRHEVLKEAISRRLILTSKVPNPKDPQFPVTAIRLNRLLPEVRASLSQAAGTENDFDPVSIPGENLSATVLRERR